MMIRGPPLVLPNIHSLGLWVKRSSDHNRGLLIVLLIPGSEIDVSVVTLPKVPDVRRSQDRGVRRASVDNWALGSANGP